MKDLLLFPRADEWELPGGSSIESSALFSHHGSGAISFAVSCKGEGGSLSRSSFDVRPGCSSAPSVETDIWYLTSWRGASPSLVSLGGGEGGLGLSSSTGRIDGVTISGVDLLGRCLWLLIIGKGTWKGSSGMTGRLFFTTGALFAGTSASD